MHILLCVHHETDLNSGAPGSIMELADAYREAGHKVTFLSWDDFPATFPIRAKQLLFPGLAAWRMWKAARKFDVIDASTGDAWVWGRLRRFLPTGRGPLLVTRSHGLEHIAADMRRREASEGRIKLSWRYPLYYGGLHLWEVAQSLRLADRVFLLNEHDLTYATSRLGVPAERCAVVRYGLPDELLGLPGPAEPPGEEREVVTIGALSMVKGIEYSIPALVELLQSRPTLTLRMLGTRSPAAEILSRLPATVHGRVRVVERYRRAELPSLLQNSQILLFASLSEGFGKAALEAMACGLAPVCGDCGGPTEFVEDGVNGLVVPTRDRAAIVDAIERLLDDPPMLERLRAAAYDTAQDFAWRDVAHDRLKIYQQALCSN